MLKDSGSRIKAWWVDLTGKQQIGYLLTACAVILTLLLAVLRSGEKPPSAGWIVGLAVLGIVSQAASAFSFGQVGKVNPDHAQSVVRNLYELATAAKTSRTETEALFEKFPQEEYPAGVHTRIGKLSVHLSYTEQGVSKTIQDWKQFHKKAVEKAEKEIVESGGNEQQNENNGRANPDRT